MDPIKTIFLICTLFLGGFMIYGSIGKFSQAPSPISQIEQFEEIGMDNAKADDHLQIKNFIFGLKQTGYFWFFLGICELLCGILIISQSFSLLGASIALPITINIFLFHLFLESHEIGELLLTFLLLLANVYILYHYYPKWKHLVMDREIIGSYRKKK